MSVVDGMAHAVRTSPADLRIWMADDDPDEHVFVELAARESGLRSSLRFLADGGQLLDALDAITDPDELPHLLLLDLRMPGLDGHRTLERLEADERFRHIPVVVFSSSTQRMDQARSFARGALWYVTKPSDFDGMVEIVRSLEDRAATGNGWAHGDALPRHMEVSESVRREVESALRPQPPLGST